MRPDGAPTPCRSGEHPPSGSSATSAPRSSSASSSPHTTLIATADGTGGTHAGLVAGWGDHDAVLGVDVGTRPDLDDVVPAKRRRPPTWRRWRPQRARAASITARSATATARRPASCSRSPRPRARASRGCCSIRCTPARRWRASSPRSAAAALPAEGTIVFLATGGLPALLTPRYTDWITKWP